MAANGSHHPYDASGVVETQVLARLSAYGPADFSASIAQRSPLGSRAVRVQVSAERDRAAEVECEDLARWLSSQPFVDAVSARPPNVYLRISTDALRAWLTDPVGADFHTHAQLGHDLALVRFAEPDPERPRSLDEFREAAMGRAVAALLGSRGFDLVIERTLAGELREPEPESELAATAVVVGAAVPQGEAESRAEVGAVDVRHGSLRARNGGSVSAEDVLREIRERHAFGIADVDADWRQAYAEALLTFALLRTARTRRVELDDDKLSREAAEFGAVLAARACPRDAGVLDDVGDDAVRELAVELDLLPTVIARAASALEPSFLIRFARSVAERTRAARSFLPPTDPLWPVVDEAIDLALSLAGIYVPPEVWSAASRAPLGPEQPHPWVGIGPTGDGWAQASMN